MKEKVNSYLRESEKFHASEQIIREIISTIDLTTLNPTDNDETVTTLCHKATTQFGDVAAVCVYPQFIPVVVDTLGDCQIKKAAVANFPTGNGSLNQTVSEITNSITAGANEIDVVFPYTAYLSGDKNSALEFIAECKLACGKANLKVILETSEIYSQEELYVLSQELISLDVNFLKTSTGKSAHGATLEDAAVMLLAIREKPCNTGFKASGGIKTFEQACAYLSLAKRIMGDQWVTPGHFRIGASSLLDELLDLAST